LVPARPDESMLRVIAASNRDLSAEVKARRFRSDLFYRLNGMVITLAGLRDRPEDVAILARHFLDELPGLARLSSQRHSAQSA